MNSKSKSPRAKKAEAVKGRTRTPRPVKQAVPCANEDRFRGVFESSRDAMGVSLNGIHVFVNPAYLKLFGFPPDMDLAGKPILDLVAPASRDQIREYIRGRMRGEAVPSFYETRGLRTDGSQFDMEVNVSLIREKGKDHNLVVLRDITRRKMAEADIVEHGALVQQIMDTASVAIFLVDMTGRIIHANDRMAQMFGCTMADLVGSEYVAHVHPSERETGRQKMLALLASKISSVDLERLYWRKDGSQFWGHLAGRRFYDVNGRELGLIGVITDITDRKRAEVALRASEKKFSAIFSLIPDPTTITDIEDGTIVDLNDSAARWFGLSRAEAIGKTTADVRVWADPADRDRMLEKIRKEGEINDLECRLRMYSGEIRDVLFSSRVMEIEGRKYLLSRAHDMAERRQAELALQRSEAKYRRFYNETPVLLHSVDRNGILVEVNDFWLKTLGYDREEVIGRRFTDFYAPASKKYADEVVYPAFLRDGIIDNVSYQFIKKNGDIVDVLLSATAVRDAAGNVVHSQAVIQDITERKRMEEALAKSEKMLQTIIDAEPECVKLLDKDARVIMMNRAGLDMIQADSLDQVAGQSVCPLITPGDCPAFLDLTRRVFQGESGTLVFEVVGIKGRHVWLETHAVPLRNEKNEITALLGVTRDVTERKRTEEELREKEKKYRVLFESANDGIFIYEDNRFMDCNQKGTDMYGLPKEKVIGRSPVEFAPERQPDGRLSSDVAREKVQAALNGIPQAFEWQSLRADGSPFDVEITLSRLELGGRMRLQAIVRDITERKRIEHALRSSEARFRSIIEHATEGIMVADAETGQITYANPEICRILDYSEPELLSLKAYDLAVPEESEQSAHAFKAHSKDRMFSSQRTFKRKNGDPVRMNIKAMQIELDGRASVLGFFADVTAQHLLEEERLKTHKLESLGTLAGGIAHDFNNLLQGVFGFISMAKLTHDQKEKSLSMLEQAEKALHQSVSLTSQLLTFSKGGKPLKKVLSLRPVIEDAVKFALSGSRAVATLSIAGDLVHVDADAGQIGQVIQNIVLNADQAMPLGGTIEISARNVFAASVPELHDRLQGEVVEIRVRDRGLGMPQEHLAMIFDPYFTTKEKGSGLGLATSYSIIRNHGGVILASSELGKGSTFTIYLPASTSFTEQAAAFENRSAVQKGKVLVMDDDAVVCDVARALLNELGHEVEIAGHGEAAIEKYQNAKEAGTPFDVVILDLTIRGGIGGTETIRKLLTIDPDVKAVVSSGYSDDAALSNYREQGFKAFLKKPYDIRELEDTLNVLLA
jgi:PAS domain S-box-containing protein